MREIAQELTVRFRYPVHFTRNVFAPANSLLRDVVAAGNRGPVKALVVLDRGACAGRPDLPLRIDRYCLRHSAALTLVRSPLLVPGGERVKSNGAYVGKVLDAIDAHGLCRHSFVIVVGGGAVLDMAGFAAATAHRGIRLVRVPTTVLSQNDSGVGVKNGINAFGKKNFLGTFAPPWAVVNDSAFLQTLPDRDWRAGTAEAVKVALLRDPEFFEFLEREAPAIAARDMRAMEHLVRRCAELHLQHIAGGNDPFETGSSRPLDLGHWAAHKLEQLTGFRLRHGEAVAIGLALDTTYAMLAGLLREAEWRRILRLLSALGFALRVPARFRSLTRRDDPGCLLHGLVEFQEHMGGELTIMMVQTIGAGVEVHEMSDALVAESIRTLDEHERQARRNERLARRTA